MIVTTSALATLSAKSEPEPGDTRLTIPPVAVIPVMCRLPLRALDAAPGSSTAGTEFSFSIFTDTLVLASTAASSVNLGYLGPGLWELSGSIAGKIDFAPTPTATTQVGLAFVQPPAVLASTWALFLPAEGYTDQINIAPRIFQFDTITQVILRTPATGVGETARVFSTLQACRLI